MDFSIENKFVKEYIKKEYQERLLFELQSKKHREKAISRFAHSSETILKDCFRKSSILELQKGHEIVRTKEQCYILSNDAHDGRMLLWEEAIRYCAASYMVTVLISEKTVVIKEEFEKGEPLILISNKK